MYRQSLSRLLPLLALLLLGLWGSQARVLASPSNDDYPGTLISGLPGNITGTTVGATRQSGEYYYGDGSSVWYQWTAPVSGGVTFSTSSNAYNVIGVYQGGFASSNKVASNGYETYTPSVTFHATAGVTYSISISGTFGDTGSFALNWVAGPANDDYTTAQIVDSRSTLVTGTTVGATRQSGEYYYGDGSSVWYQWTAPVSGGVTFSTSSNAYNVIGVYQGGFASSNKVASNGYETYTPSVTFHATAGVTYSISISGTFGDTGSFLLYGGSAPLNDAFANAQSISGSSGEVRGSNISATSEPGEPQHDGQIGGSSVWYQWTAPVSGSVTFDSSTSNFNTLLALYTGSDITHLTPVGSNLYGNAINLKKSTLTVNAGTTYYIAVDGLGGQTGEITLDWGNPFSSAQAFTHALWTNSNGTASIVSYNLADGSSTSHAYGPYTGWYAQALGDGTDGKTEVLWENYNGTASVVNYNLADGSYTSHAYGPYTGWYASAISGGVDGTAHVLWNNYNGTASIVSCNLADGSSTPHAYGPYIGWYAWAIADGNDGGTRVLWKNYNGTASIVNYNLIDGSSTSHAYGPYTGWYASALSVGADGNAHVLWNNFSGTASVVNYSTSDGSSSSHAYGPYTGWYAKALTDGPDGKTQVLWDNYDGRASLINYNLADGSSLLNTYGPYGGWTATALSTSH